ncbi:hypothetical protein ILYODFUR_032546 [Ilyodon furcidens]|uniref:Prolactin receptor n=1 Tax=Ilyodon furcidens TaxID=33524 RepID=A0ABV0TCW5_9TELE
MAPVSKDSPFGNASHGVAHSASIMGQGKASPCKGQSQSCRRLGSGCEIRPPSWERRSLLEGGASASVGRACAAEDTGPYRPKWGYQQKPVPLLENPQELLEDLERGKGIEKGPGPLVRQCIASPEDWHCPSGRTRGHSELHPWRQTGPPLPGRRSPKCDPPPLGEAAIPPEVAPSETESPRARSADLEYRPPETCSSDQN